VEVYNSKSYYERSPPSPTDEIFLTTLVTDLLKALANPTTAFYRLLSPLLPLLPSQVAPFEQSHHTSPKSRQEYQAENAKHSGVAYELRERFSHTPFVFLLADTDEKRWAETCTVFGMEHTVIVEKALMKVLALQTPEARLFSLLAVYHEIGHLFKRWVSIRVIQQG
jgi:hypothetical protein